MIKSSTKIWQEISELNNLHIEFDLLHGVIPVIRINDVFKYPDKVYDFLSNLDYWETKDFNTNSVLRPGLTHVFTEPLYAYLTKELSSAISMIFGVDKLKITDVYVQACSGSMTLDPTSILGCYPHMDAGPFDLEDGEPIIVTNINLSKSDSPVSTGFWSWRGKHSCLDFTKDDKNSLINFYDRQEKKTVDKWFQITDFDDFRFETSADMSYNSLVAYSTGYLHNPYIMPEWFQDSHRLMMSIFYNFSPSDISDNSELICKSWDHFRLNTLFNHYPLNK